MLSPQEQDEFRISVENVQRAVLAHLSANRNQTFAIAFVSNLQRGVDDVVQSAMDRGEQFQCRAGCSHCCNVRVEALDPEIFRIANELKLLPPQELEQLIVRLQRHAQLTQGVSVQDHHSACPFLIENLCSIYPVRPAVCRKVHSYDVESCRTRSTEIPENLEAILKAEALMKGTSAAYSQIELPASAHELGAAVLLALTDETAESRWYGGESVFA